MCFHLYVTVLSIPAKCGQISVCLEPDKDLRVDCTIKPKHSKTNTYEFSWWSGTEEIVIATNVSRSTAEESFKSKSNVEVLKSGAYRMILSDVIEKLQQNTTFVCKLSEETARVTVDKGG